MPSIENGSDQDQIWFLGSDNLFASLSEWPPITYHLMILVMVVTNPLSPPSIPDPSARQDRAQVDSWGVHGIHLPLVLHYRPTTIEYTLNHGNGCEEGGEVEFPECSSMFFVPGQFELRFLSVFIDPAARSRTTLSFLALALALA